MNRSVVVSQIMLQAGDDPRINYGFFGVALENGLLELVPSVLVPSALGATLTVGITGRLRSKNGPGSTATSSKRTS